MLEPQSNSETGTMTIMTDRALPQLGGDVALFLDFDGTLVEIAPRPEAVVLEPEVREALARLYASRSGAVAIVSGRPIADLDAILSPLRLPVAGVHGLELRLADGRILQEDGGGDLVPLLREMQALIAAEPELWLEEKPGALALHTRARPDLEAACRQRLEPLVRADPGLTLLHGHRILEVKGAKVSKGTAVARFMAEPPFAERWPLFVGDDVTDEDGILAAQRLGGLGLKIGSQESAAKLRLDDGASFRAWLIAQAWQHS